MQRQMAEPGSVLTVDPKKLDRNPENPRLVFREDELASLRDSIAAQGILVPLTVYRESSESYVLLDGERRWRCSLKLGLSRVPVIVQPKPDRLANIMMMFAIHNSRRDWDPLPTAFKLRELETEFTQLRGRKPKEGELAEVASMSRGEVRRLKKLLDLPQEYHERLLAELEKPRHLQVLTVDHVLETTKGVSALVKRGLVAPGADEDHLRKAIIGKLEKRVITSTVEPRKLAKIARAVEREEVRPEAAKRAVRSLLKRPQYTIDDAFRDTAERAEFEHGVRQRADQLASRLEQLDRRGGPMDDDVRQALLHLRLLIDDLVS